MEYRIPAVNYPKLQEEINKLNKRAKKLGLEPVKFDLVRTEIERQKQDFLDFECEEIFYYCTVEGETPHLAGWRLVAVVKPVGDECLIREVPGQICPEQYRNTDYHCDHCNLKRRRSAIFVLQNEETNEYKQVGRNCIADFLGGVEPEQLLNAAEFVFNYTKLVSDAQESNWHSGVKVVSIFRFMAVVNMIGRRIGYVSRSEARETMKQSTSDLAWELCTSPPNKELSKFIADNNLHIEQIDLDTAKLIIEWASSITPDQAKNTYQHDLGVCCRQEVTTWDRAAYVASAFKAYNSEMRTKVVRNNVNSVHVGEIKNRQTFLLTVVSLHSCESEWGPQTRVTFTDDAGNILVWWASGHPEWLNIGATVSCNATVKKHSEFQGIKHTELTRVRPLDT